MLRASARRTGIYHTNFIDYSINVRSITSTMHNRSLSGAGKMRLNETKDDRDGEFLLRLRIGAFTRRALLRGMRRSDRRGRWNRPRRLTGYRRGALAGHTG